MEKRDMVDDAYDTRHEPESERQHYIDLFQFAPDGYVVTDLDGILREANQAMGEMLNIRPDLLTGKPLQLYLAETNRPEFIARVTTLIQAETRTTEWEVGLLPRGDLPPIITAASMSVMRSKNHEPVALCWLFRDITQRKKIENDLRAVNTRLEQRVREHTERLIQETQLKDAALVRERTVRLETDALRETGMILSSTFDSGEVLRRILAAVGRIVQHDAADIVLLENGELSPACCHGYSHCDDMEYITGLRFPLNGTFPLDRIALTRRPVMQTPLEQPLAWVQRMDGDTPVHSYLGVPVYIRNEIIGFINLTSRTPNFFTSEHIRLLELFSIQAAFAIQNARAHETAQAVLLLEERNRLARDLHDAVSQSLFTASILAETLLASAETRPNASNELLGDLVRLTRGAQAEMRSLLLELRPAHLTEVDLPIALRRLIDAVWARKDIKITLDLNINSPLPGDVQMAFYRIAQEALNNIVKHAHASSAAVSLHSNGVVRMIIADDGDGFDLAQWYPGMGVSNMKERAEAVNATLEVTSAPGRGTQVVVEWKRVVP